MTEAKTTAPGAGRIPRDLEADRPVASLLTERRDWQALTLRGLACERVQGTEGIGREAAEV